MLAKEVGQGDTRRVPAPSHTTSACPPCTFPRHLSSKPSVEVLAALPTDAPYSSSTSLAATRNSMCGNDVLPSAHFFTDVHRVPPTSQEVIGHTKWPGTGAETAS